MKFDPKKPHGVITNHEWARYDQDGVLYDWQGLPRGLKIEEEDVEQEIVPTAISVMPGEIDFAMNNAKDFLTNILSGGALARSVIFKECTANNQSWEKVKTAFANMGGEAFQRRNVIHWKLKAE